MKALLAALALLVPAAVTAHTGGEVSLTCPLDGTEFTAWQDFSGTAFGARLDLKQQGAIASPWTLAQCPQCRLPLYKRVFSETEKTELRAIVQSPDFVEAAKTASPYGALARIRKAMSGEPFPIAWAYLQSTWQLEEQEGYGSEADYAIEWFDKAAKRSRDTDDLAEFLVASYLPIELLRRKGQFAEAQDRLRAFPSVRGAELDWLDDALRLEGELIAKRDSSVHDIPRKDPQPKASKQHALTPTTDAEKALLEDGRRLAAGCQIYLLTEGTAKVPLAIDPQTGALAPPLLDFVLRLTPGTRVLTPAYEVGKGFSLVHAEAFAGRAVVFDEEGWAIE